MKKIWNKNKAKTKKQYWIHLVLLMVLGGVVGLVTSFLFHTTDVSLSISIDWNFVFHSLSLFLLGISIALTILSKVFLSKCRHYQVDLESDEDFVSANKFYDLSTAANSLVVPPLFAHMGLLTFIETNGFLYFTLLIVFLVIFILTIIQSHNIVKEISYFTSLNNINPYDEKAVKTLPMQLDEGAKSIAYEASFLSYRKLLTLFYALTTGFSFLTLMNIAPPGYLLLVMSLTVIASIIHFIEGWKLEYGKEKHKNETNSI